MVHLPVILCRRQQNACFEDLSDHSLLVPVALIISMARRQASDVRLECRVRQTGDVNDTSNSHELKESMRKQFKGCIFTTSDVRIHISTTIKSCVLSLNVRCGSYNKSLSL